MTQMINNSILTNASYKLRLAQDLTLYLAEIALDLENFSADAGKQHWLDDPIWQGTREAAETVLAIQDHLEAYFTANIIFEPLITELVRSGFVMQFAAAQNDFVTPSIVSAAEGEYERNLANTVELFHLLTHDEKHGANNRTVIQGWLSQHVPRCLNAANGLQPLWSQPRVKVAPFSEALASAKNRVQSVLSQIEVEMPKGVQL
jgi:propane monooxygenase small subunit